MTADEVKRFHEDLNEHLRVLAEKWNFELVKNSNTYGDAGCKITLETVEKSASGEFKVDSDINFKLWSALKPFVADLPETVQGYTFQDGKGVWYQIMTWNTRARSYPIIYKRLSDGAQFKASALFIGTELAAYRKRLHAEAQERMEKRLA